MNLDFASGNRALVRRIDSSDTNFVAVNNSVPALLLFVPGCLGSVNVRNSGTDVLVVEHCRVQIEVAAGEAKDLQITPGDLIDTNASVPEVVAVEPVVPARVLPPRIQAIRDAQAARVSAVVTDEVNVFSRPAAVTMSNAKIRKRV